MPTDIRHTKQRQAVLRTVKLSVQPISADAVQARLQRLFPSISVATVYRNLDFLAKRGEIYRVDSEDGVRRFIGHSFHQVVFRCQRCGKERSLPSATLQDYVNRKMVGPQTIFFSRLTAQGLCASCLNIIQRQYA